MKNVFFRYKEIVCIVRKILSCKFSDPERSVKFLASGQKIKLYKNKQDK